MLRKVDRNVGRPKKSSDGQTNLEKAIEAGHLKRDTAHRYEVMDHCPTDDMEAHFINCRARRKENAVRLPTSKEVYRLGLNEMNRDLTAEWVSDGRHSFSVVSRIRHFPDRFTASIISELGIVFNLRLGDGLAPKTIDGGAVEVLAQDALTAPLVAVAAQDDED